MRFRHYNKAIVPVIIAVFILRYAELSFLTEKFQTHITKQGDFYHYIFYIIYALGNIFLYGILFLPAKNCSRCYVLKMGQYI